MRLYANIQGNFVSMDMSPYASIYCVKQLLNSNFAIPVQAQTILFAGRTLLDKESLMQVGITKDATVLVHCPSIRFVLPSAPPGIGTQVYPSAPPMDLMPPEGNTEPLLGPD